MRNISFSATKEQQENKAGREGLSDELSIF